MQTISEPAGKGAYNTFAKLSVIGGILALLPIVGFFLLANSASNDMGGLLSVFLIIPMLFIGPIFGLLSFAFGVFALYEIARNGETGIGSAIFGILVGLAMIAFVFLSNSASF